MDNEEYVETNTFEEGVHSSFQEEGDDEQGYALGAQPRNDVREETVLTRVAKYIIYAGIVLVPLFFLSVTSDSLELPKQTLIFFVAAAALIVWMIDVLQAGVLRMRMSVVNWAVLGFIGSVILATVFSLNAYKSIFGSLGSGSNSLVTLASLAGMYFVIVNVFTRKEIIRLVELFSFSLLAAIAFAVFQSFNIHLLPLDIANSRAFTTAGSLNSVGVLAALGVALGLGSFTYTKITSPKGIASFALVAFSFILLVIANWWVLWVITIVGLVGHFGFAAMQRGYHVRDFIIAGVSIGIILLVMISNLRLDIRDQLPIEVAISNQTSFDIAKGALNKSPVWGFGPENFALAYDLYKPASINNTAFWSLRFSDSSSELINRTVESGVVGLAFSLILLISVLIVLFGAMRSSARGHVSGEGENDEAEPNSAIVMPVFLALVATFVLYPFTVIMYFALFLFAAIAVVGASNGEHSPVFGGVKGWLFAVRERTFGIEDSPRNSMVTSIGFTGVIILMIVGGYFVMQQLRANVLFAKTVQMDESEDAAAITDNFNQMLVINPSEDLYYRNYMNFLIRRTADAINAPQGDRNEAAQRVQLLAANAVNVSKRLTDIHPHDSFNWLNRGFVYQNFINLIRGSDGWALRSYEEFTKLSPTNPLGYSRRGNVYLAVSDSIRNLLTQNQNLSASDRQSLIAQYDENLALAEEDFKKAIELKRDLGIALYNLGVVYDRQGRVKEAIDQLRTTTQAAPNQAGLAFELGLLYLRDNNIPAAQNELERAVALFDGYSNARWFLALIYENNGEIERAINQLQKILEFNPDNQLVQEKLENLLAGVREIPPGDILDQTPIQQPVEQR